MSIQLDHLAQQQKSAIDTAVALASIGVTALESNFALGIAASRQLLDAQNQWNDRFPTVRTPQELAALTTEVSAPLLEHGVSQLSQTYEIIIHSGELTAKLLESRHADAIKSAGALIDEFARRAPAGSEPAVAALRSGVEAVNSAVGRLQHVARQVAEATEANVAASSKATLKAVSAGAAANAANSGSASSKKKTA